ncbi:MAG: radical SAM family heme chaperone HemW [Bryobacterales bacterium]|nr:radical SAM family heme chaperone HemW [Bryobacterales bacterium]MBV9396648.1 radical SAM family heme chaperone HemW [Bryobacterales bacterium]
MAGVYISYPFCAQKCTYCNFASGVLPLDLEKRYLEALKLELRGTDWPWVPETVYLGGGTPSRIDPADLAEILAVIPGKPWAEATIEAAPGGISPELAQAWRNAGISRVSLGVQSFVTRELARTGRKHTAEIVAAEIEVLRAGGLDNFNIDLIAGLPGQTEASWNASLDWVERLEPPHLSVYMLEVDADSRLGAEILAFGKRYGASDVPSDDAIAGFYEIAVERLAASGVRRYEISNFARPALESRHNLKYWRREPYFGFGSDAHSFDGATRWQNVESAAEYVGCLEQHGSPVAACTATDPAETFFLGLRLEEGIEADWSSYQEGVERFQQEGLLEIKGSRLRLTPRGVLLSNEVFAHFV